MKIFDAQRRGYKCTVCGKAGVWDKNWSYYGSYAHAEACPNDIPFACSEPCMKIIDNNLKSGKWRLPTLKMSPGGAYVSRERKGY